MNKDLKLKIELYISGSMNLEQSREFQILMESDPKIAEEVDLYKSINHHFIGNTESSFPPLNNQKKQLKELQNYFKSNEAQSLEIKLREAQTTYLQKNKSSYFKVYYIAAAIVLLLASSLAYLYLNQPSSEELYVEYYSDKDFPSLVSRGVSDQSLNNGIAQFYNRNFEEALKNLMTYLETYKDPNPLVYSYVGWSQLELGDLDKAISNFDILIKSDHIDNSKGLWYKALAYLKTGKIKELQEVLQLIIKDPQNFNYDEAVELLEQL